MRCFYWLPSNAFSICQSLLLKIKGVRKFLGVPAPVKPELGQSIDVGAGLRKMLGKASEEAESVPRVMEARPETNNGQSRKGRGR